MSSSSSRSSSRYNNSFDNHRSSSQSDPSSSTDLTKNRSQCGGDLSRTRALAKSRSTRNDQNLSAMVKKFMSSSTKPKPRDLVVAANVTTLIADDFKKKTTITTGFKKLFGTKSHEKTNNDKKKALPEARTLATVLRSERELLSRNKEQETEILHLNSMLQDKNREVDKLKDLCLKQREEIKALKKSVPEEEVIPSLQRQVTCLTSQLLYLAKDVAQVKAQKYRSSYEGLISPTTHDQEEATNSVDDFSSASPDEQDMFLNDLNPCLTPYANSKSKSKERYSSSYNNNISTRYDDNDFAQPRILSKSNKILGPCVYGQNTTTTILHC